MKKIFLFIISALMTISLFAAKPKSKAKSNKKMPSWVESPYSMYSSETFFAAVGSDRNKNQAELKAVEALAGIFGRDVESSSKADSSMTHVEDGDGTATELMSTLNQQILMEMDQKDLIGIEIKETFQDENNNTWYALATLDKEKTAGLYLTMIRNNNKSIDTMLAAARDLPASMKKLAYYYRAIRLCELNDSYFPRFYIVHPEKCEEARSTVKSTDKLRVDFDKIASQNPIKVTVKNDYNSIIQIALEELLKSFGFTVNQKSALYNLEMDITPTYRSVDDPPMEYCEFIISSKLYNSQKTSIVPWSFSGRAGGKNIDLARQKAYALMSGKIQSEYAKIFEEYLYGETK